MKEVYISELSKIKMVAGNEHKYSKVIHKGVVKEWVAIGWITLEEPTPEEIKTLPHVKE